MVIYCASLEAWKPPANSGSCHFTNSGFPVYPTELDELTTTIELLNMATHQKIRVYFVPNRYGTQDTIFTRSHLTLADIRQLQSTASSARVGGAECWDSFLRTAVTGVDTVAVDSPSR